MKARSRMFAILLSSASFAGAHAQEISTPPGESYKSNIPPDQRRVYFGELHLHTTMSFDAWTFGTKITPDLAYKFGRGETVMVPAAQLGMEQGAKENVDVPAKRAWPLDFMAVTDHSESMGVLTQLDDPNNPLAKTPIGQSVLKNPPAAFFVVARMRKTGKPLPGAAGVMRHAWDVEVKAANDNYEPGKFTTFIAYEWSARVSDKKNPTSNTPIGTIHRNVFFNSDHAPMPFTSADSEKPEDLWSYLEKTRAQGIDVLAIPHNGNLSGGMMYDWNDSDGRPIDEQYAQRRALNEPLTEIVQNKGQSDTVPSLSPSDEFANFEIYDRLLVSKDFKSKPDGSYIRQAFGHGLAIQSKIGVNPFKYGVVGASDIHNGLSASNEDAMASGPYGIDPNTMLPKGDAAKHALGILKTPIPSDPDENTPQSETAYVDVLKFSSAGITGVWAEENTRNAIFAALKRKETFATSGTRIRVRMFAGWNFDPKMIENGDWVAKAYAQGVPMGGDLPARTDSAGAPSFILQAVKDPDGANLDRVQVIKVWLENGDYREKIFDVAVSGKRKINPKTGHAGPVGNTVNLKTGAYKNTIGATVLTTVWRDPEFDPTRPTVYYARTLEIPTPRWSTLLAIKSRLPIPKDAAATIQERAWTSPIWFTPAKS
jgi:Protein of unknown function (DUF3604)